MSWGLPEPRLATLSFAAAACYGATGLLAGCDPVAAATVAAVGFAALLSSIGGFAFSAICGALLFQFRSEMVEAVQIMLVCSTANQTLSVWALRRDIRWRALAPFVAGGVPGVFVGLFLLLGLDARVYLADLGLLLLVYGAVMLFRKPTVLRHVSVLCDVAVGFVGGAMGGFAASPGAVVSVWCGMKGLDRTAQRAVFQPFVLIMQVLALAGIAALRSHGAHTPAIPMLAVFCVPSGMLGTAWGLACFRRLSDRTFRTVIHLLLMVSGLGLML